MRNSKARLLTLCGDRACRIALVVAPCEFSTSPANPLQGSCASNRSRCGAVRIVNFAGDLWGSCALDRSLAATPCEFQHSSVNPLRVSCALKRSRCGAARILNADCEPSPCFRRMLRWRVERLANSAGCWRVERFAHSFRYPSQSTTTSWFWAGGSAGVRSVPRVLFVIEEPSVVFGRWRRWRVELLRNSFRNQQLSSFGGQRRWRIERAQNSARNG